MEDPSQPCTCNPNTTPEYEVVQEVVQEVVEEVVTPRPVERSVPNAPLKAVWTPTLGSTPVLKPVTLSEYYPSTIIQPPYPILNYNPDANEPHSLKLIRTLSHNYEAQVHAHKYMPLCEEGETIFTNYWLSEDNHLDFTYLKRKGDVFYQIEVHTTLYGEYKKDYTYSCCQPFIKGVKEDPFTAEAEAAEAEAAEAAL